FPDFAALWPEKFQNKTNGVTPRRWLLAANPRLAGAITDKIGAGWVTNLDELKKLVPYADDPEFRARTAANKLANKPALARVIRRTLGLRVDPTALFSLPGTRVH